MSRKQYRLAQEFVNENRVVELCLTKQQCLELISLIAKDAAIMSPFDQLLVMHFITSDLQRQSNLLPGVYIPQATTISHVELSEISEHSRVLADEMEIEKLAKWLEFLDN